MAAQNPDEAKAFLGVGWAFPLSLDVQVTGDFALSVYEQNIRESISIILQTNPGERVMRPDFGAGLDSFLFAPIDGTTMPRMARQVREALIDWEPRIIVQDVTVTADMSAASTLLISMTYQIRVTNTVHNLVYPFFLDEGAAK